MELRVENLSCRRGGLPVLAGVSFSVRRGRALILRGPNGVGKTTLLRTIAGLQLAETGAIHAPEESIAYAGHLDGLKSALTVQQNLRFWASAYGTYDISPALEAFDLAPLLNRQAFDLSAGQKRRLGLGRLAVTGRPIWLFDEPTVSLDAENTELFAQMVHKHLETGGIALMATHIELGLANADRLDLGQFRALEDTETGDVFLDGGF